MKKERTRESITDKTMRAAAVLDRQPVAMILFMVFCAAMMIGGAMIYNTVVPAYQ